MPELKSGAVFDVAPRPVVPDPDDGIVTEAGGVLVDEAGDVIEHVDWTPAPLVVAGAPNLSGVGQGPVVTGTGDVGAVVTVTGSRGTARSTEVADDGTWSLDLSFAGPGLTLLVFEQVAAFGIRRVVEARLSVSS